MNAFDPVAVRRAVPEFMPPRLQKFQVRRLTGAGPRRGLGESGCGVGRPSPVDRGLGRIGIRRRRTDDAPLREWLVDALNREDVAMRAASKSNMEQLRSRRGVHP